MLTVLKFLLAYFSIAMFSLWYRRYKNAGKPPFLGEKTVMILFGSGGHTTEMLHMLDGLRVEKYGQVVFVLGHSDSWSLTKISATLPPAML